MEPTPSAATDHHHHRRRRRSLEDPTSTTPSTVENISLRFSKLYANHKKLVSNHSNPESPHLHPHPQPDPHFQSKPIPHTRLPKSNSLRERQSSFKNDSAAVKFVEKEGLFRTLTHVEDKEEIKKPSSKKSSLDAEKPSQLVLECEKVKGFPQGFEVIKKKAFCSPQVEMGKFFSCSGVKVVAVDMPPLMQIHAVDCARKAHDSLEKFNSKTLALTLKKEFDGAYGAAWHCIVGSSFGSFVTHSVGGFVYFSLDHKIFVLLFKTDVQRAKSS